MTSNPFATPATASGISWKDLKGSLLLITPHSVEEGIKTAYGESDAIRADVVILDGDQAGEEYADTLIFPRVLQSQVRSRIGSKVLGRLGQGNAKGNQDPPWLLAEATEADIAVGKAHLAGALAGADQPPF